MTQKMTQKDWFALIHAAVDTHPNLSDEAKVGMCDFISGRINALDRKHNASGANPKRDAEVRATVAAITAVMGNHQPMTATAIGNAAGMNVQKASANLRKMVAAGKVTRTEGKVVTFTLN